MRHWIGLVFLLLITLTFGCGSTESTEASLEQTATEDGPSQADDTSSPSTETSDSNETDQPGSPDASDETEEPVDTADSNDALPFAADSLYAQNVESFEPGSGAGFGQDNFPGIVLGPPDGIGTGAGSLDVLSLGVGGTITLSFGNMQLIDGDGPDLLVFENPFWMGNDPTNIWAELGEVAVSQDGETWFSWSCEPTQGDPATYDGCAGWEPSLPYDTSTLSPLDPDLTGGNAFDLADLDLTFARFVRIRDLATEGAAPTAGFDLDAVGIIHGELIE